MVTLHFIVVSFMVIHCN